MRIAINGRQLAPTHLPEARRFIANLQAKGVAVFCCDRLAAQLPELSLPTIRCGQLPADLDYLISLGGDGTFLDSVLLVAGTHIPVLGINTGRLGFLSNIPLEESEQAINALLNNNYTLEERSMLHISGAFLSDTDIPYALNEIGIQKHLPAMISIRVRLNGERLPDYWADGLLVSTPTGSTAYSMSVGGPIMMPATKSLLLSPIASHNLSTRPLVIDDQAQLQLQVFTRHDTAVVSLDNRLYEVPSGAEIWIKKAPFTLKTIRLHGCSFFSTLHEKLLWGTDKRNTPD